MYDSADIVQELAAGMPSPLLQGLRIDEPLLRDRTDNYLADALGSVIALTDSAGVPETTYTYEPFGRTEASGASKNFFQYMGRENDETGLYYFRARYYDAQLGRFVQEDPLGLSAGINHFAFVRNRPTMLRDPFGLFDLGGFKGGVGLLVGAIVTFGVVASGVGPVVATILVTTGVVQLGLGAALTAASLAAAPGTLRDAPTSLAQAAAIVATANSSDDAKIFARQTAMFVDLALAAAEPVLAGKIGVAQSLEYTLQASDVANEVRRNRRRRTLSSPTTADLIKEGTLTWCGL